MDKAGDVDTQASTTSTTVHPFTSKAFHPVTMSSNSGLHGYRHSILLQSNKAREGNLTTRHGHATPCPDTFTTAVVQGRTQPVIGRGSGGCGKGSQPSAHTTHTSSPTASRHLRREIRHLSIPYPPPAR